MTDAAGLTAELREQVLVHLGDRLIQGEVLVSGKQFVNAAEEGFLTLTGEPVAAANAADPTQLLVLGFENWVTLSVLAQVRKAGWGITEVQAMLSLTVLINRLIRPTPFRKELRLLKINLIIEEFYHATADVEQARQRATDFMRGRLRSLNGDMSREETEELQRRDEEIVQRAEEKVVAERDAIKAQQKVEADGGEQEEQEDEEDRGANSLSEEDKKRGVQVQRIAVPIAGRIRHMRHRILCKRDPDSAEMIAVLRRGLPRYVDRMAPGNYRETR